MRLTTFLFARCLLGLALTIPAWSQEPTPPAQGTPARAEAFYSGTIAELADDKITVSRTVLGKPAEEKTFAVTPDTKIEGTLRAKSRVTVRFTSGESGDIALSILVREKTEKKK